MAANTRQHPITPEKTVRQLLRQGIGKKAILDRLGRDYDREDLLFYLNNLPAEPLRRRFLPLNILLCLILLALTLKNLYLAAMFQLSARAAGQFSPLLFLDLVVPMINFYVLAKLVRCQRQGYQFMLVLGVLALFRAENRVMPDLAGYLLILALSGLLYKMLFPRSAVLS